MINNQCYNNFFILPLDMAFKPSAILCRSSDNTTAEKVVMSSPPETVRDLKIMVENQHNVPQCLQTVEIGDRCIKTV